MEGILHTYHPGRNLLLFEHTPKPPSTSSTSPTSTQTPPTSTLLFIGGMYDNFLHPPYSTQLAHLFPRHPSQTWSVMHIQLSSAGKSFGSSSLDRDINEIASGINFIRNTLRTTTPTHNIVLMGHSTGCQDVLHYLYSPNPTPSPSSSSSSSSSTSTRPQIQGAILQAPVSDREGALHAYNQPTSQSILTSALTITTSTPPTHHSTTFIPVHLTRQIYGPAPLSITRFLSLLSPDSPDHPGPDDLFSSDLPDSRLRSTFGHITTNALLSPPSRDILVLMSADDEHLAPHVDQARLLDRWRAAMSPSHSQSSQSPRSSSSSQSSQIHGSSAVIPDAIHDMSGDEQAQILARVDMLSRVLDYIDQVVGGVDPDAYRLLRGEVEGEDGKKITGVAGRDEGIGGLEREVGDVKL